MSRWNPPLGYAQSSAGLPGRSAKLKELPGAASFESPGHLLHLAFCFAIGLAAGNSPSAGTVRPFHVDAGLYANPARQQLIPLQVMGKSHEGAR
jgi:hypothetical protein